ncbi:MAG TPA: YHS domain-containing protein [Candidatus Limnocylindrales bacterium]|nr:YHS domain-containing protein [Candidatus Limnocylindrales bacterium]
MAPNPAVTDPVCGMPVDPKSAVAIKYDGRTYYFCESTCADTFRDEPDRWIPKHALVEA